MSGIGGTRTVDPGERLAEAIDPLALERHLAFGLLDGSQQPVDDVRAELRGEALEEPPGVIGLGVEREAHPEPELRVVLEQRVAPRRARARRR